MFNLIQFLPKNRTQVKDSINKKIEIISLFEKITHLMKLAINAVIQKKYNEFDPQVSENLCQIRAYQFTLIYERLREDELYKILSRIDLFHEKCNKVLHELNFLKNSNLNVSQDEIFCLQSFIDKYELTFPLSEEIYFITHAFILTRYKLVSNYENTHIIDYNKLCNEIEMCSKTYAKRFIHNLQRNLSELSCNFIIQLSQDVICDNVYQSILRSLRYEDEVGRQAISCFEVTKIILKHAFINKKHFKITVTQLYEDLNKTISFILSPTDNGEYIVLEDKDMRYLTMPLMTFVGIVKYDSPYFESKKQYIHRFNKHGIKDIILINMACHPQYPGLLHEDKKHNPYKTISAKDNIEYIRILESEFFEYKNKQTIKKDNKNSGNVFFLTHVRCGTAMTIYHEEKITEDMTII